jgi:tRNA(His) 5'-end guanylyltransferase
MIAVQNLGDRMKAYEQEYNTTVSNDNHLLIRLDGHKFSTFTKEFIRPFDEVIYDCMISTTKDLVDYFSAYTGYVASDEITLLLPKTVNTNNTKNIESNIHIFGGRVQKIVSIVSAYCTVRFNYYLNEFINQELDLKRKEFLKSKLFLAYFDARVFSIETKEEVLNAIIWRQRDYERNSKGSFAHAYCSHKSLLNKNSQEQIDFCFENKGKKWEDTQDGYKYGNIIKRKQYQKLIKDSNEYCTRSQIINFIEKLEYSKENINKIMLKYV